MPTLYGVDGSPFVRKVRVLCAEKKIAHDHEAVIPFNPPAEFRKVSPLGKIPAWRDGDKVLADSSVICAYLERTHPEPRMYPADPYEYARALWFEEWADGGFVTIVGPKIFLQRIINPRFFQKECDESAVQKAIAEDLPTYFDYLESQLGGDWLVGKSFSIADIAVGSQFVNLAHAGVGVDAKRWPKLAKYVARVHSRPSFKEYIDKERAQLGIAA